MVERIELQVSGAAAGMQVVARNATNYLRFSFPESGSSPRANLRVTGMEPRGVRVTLDFPARRSE